MFGPIGYVDAFREANFGENQFTWWPSPEEARRNINGWRERHANLYAQHSPICGGGESRCQFAFCDHAAVIIEYEFEEDNALVRKHGAQCARYDEGFRVNVAAAIGRQAVLGSGVLALSAGGFLCCSMRRL